MTMTRFFFGRKIFSSRMGGGRCHLSTVPSWATVEPKSLGVSGTYHVPNCVDGTWSADSEKRMEIPHPLDRDAPYPLYTINDTQVTELQPFLDSLRKVPKSGLHNPLKNPHRYLEYGEISRKAAELMLRDAEFFAETIIACVPKSHAQAMAEVQVTAAFLKNFAGDNVRRLAQSFGVSGDHYGQYSTGHRWPYGPVGLISPFNFPLEIPVLQLMGALYMGNKPVLKPSEQASLVMEQYLRLLHHCGMDLADVDFLNCRGPVAQELLVQTPVRLTQFTGSSRVGEILAKATGGKIKLEDAGFDWKLLGPDVEDLDYVAWQCDQDAYALSGQKCSAQSILFVHKNYEEAGLLDKLEKNASQRSLEDLSICPVLTHTTEDILNFTERIASIPGARVLFGGKELNNHKIPSKYGAVEPTAVFVPLKELIKPENYSICVSELFAPFQVITVYDDDTLPLVLGALEQMSHHLTAAVVSNDLQFLQHVLAHTVNGTTYAGRRARTTGAPQNHWFGPAGDPRGAGIGTPEAIRLVWSCHREIIHDTASVHNKYDLTSTLSAAWTQPKPT
eukprot:CAMPEP_0194223278 /NCGR_PEP_ID=MMETSP0156-20130528/34757_1 /TAXON_ID=33649 /ORGANISM="Thalassionema nitzschioides, Strain L26-B" /LENGTH=560 /DNA_ID=CAMNT_0038954355 /DNA_START=216 /DNA_END=1898 /DNA_ORIENTATION=+